MADPDMAPFADFVAHRLTALYRYAVILTGNPHDAEDLVQEALTRTAFAWRRIRADDPERYVRTTMSRIMVNRWRRPRREHLVAEAPERPTEEHELSRIADLDGLDTALAALPQRMRAVLVLRYVDQLTEAEIAEVLGCAQGTVKSQASRALAKLRAQLGYQRTSNG